MRPLFALLLTTVLLGGITFYIQFARSVHRERSEVPVEEINEVFEVMISRTFDCEADSLAELPSLTVTFADQTVYTSSESMSMDQEIRFDITQGVLAGENELAVSANRNFLETGFGAIGVTLFRNDVAIAQQTITSEPDLSTVVGTVLFNVASQKQPVGGSTDDQ